MVRELKKGCDDFIVEALEIISEMASTRQEIGDFQHIKKMHPTEWQKMITEDAEPEDYVMSEQDLMTSLHQRLTIAIVGIHDTCRGD